MNKITIRPIKSVEGCEQFTELQRRIWVCPELDLVPMHVLITCLKNGGAILGAYDQDGPAELGGLVGAAYWWLGAGPDPLGPGMRLKACSHIVGVLPGWQGLGIGLMLKLAQRQTVLEQGITDWVTWTYDPLYLANGIFNLHRLGATCNTYAQNVYGEMQDELNRGVPSDRCQVDWLLNDPHALQQTNQRRLHQRWDKERLNILPSHRRQDGFFEPVDVELSTALSTDDRLVAVPIPQDIAAIRAADSALSLDWRLYMRHVLEKAFHDGYTMVDCVKIEQKGWHYLLMDDA